MKLKDKKNGNFEQRQLLEDDLCEEKEKNGIGRKKRILILEMSFF